MEQSLSVPFQVVHFLKIHWFIHHLLVVCSLGAWHVPRLWGRRCASQSSSLLSWDGGSRPALSLSDQCARLRAIPPLILPSGSRAPSGASLAAKRVWVPSQGSFTAGERMLGRHVRPLRGQLRVTCQTGMNAYGRLATHQRIRRSGFSTLHNCSRCKGSARRLGLGFGSTRPASSPLCAGPRGRQRGAGVEAWSRRLGEELFPWRRGLGRGDHSYFWIMTQSTQQEAFITSQVVLAPEC